MMGEVLDDARFQNSDVVCLTERFKDVNHYQGLPFEHRAFDDHAMVDRIDARLLVAADGPAAGSGNSGWADDAQSARRLLFWRITPSPD